jgi:hypothetical protein
VVGSISPLKEKGLRFRSPFGGSEEKMLEEDFPALSVPPLNLVLFEEGASPGYAPVETLVPPTEDIVRLGWAAGL